ncbi:MAG: 30S ribosomal protein S20 [Planctomycetota bacterium]|nr:30S ribosomal protein S20 [Planctomycetota bacterium]MDA1105572.1 30S ribosomal protein S20 [Planctomycetota bacterium]
MPNTDSAKKRVRQTAKRNALNTWRKRQVKDSTKAFLQAVHDGDLAVASKELSKVSGLLDRFSTKNTYHRNTAARKKSRLAARLNKAQAAKAA